MNTLKQFILVLFVILNASFCFAHPYKYPVDSIDAITKEHVRIIRHYIGEHEHRKSGQAFMEQRGSKYYITLPFYDVVTVRNYSYPIERTPDGVYEYTHKKLSDEFAFETVPKGTKIVMVLEDDEFVECRSEYDNKVCFFYGNGNMNGYGQQTRTGWEVSWLVRFELTPHDMLLLSQHHIAVAYLSDKGKHIYSPIKHKQSLRIQQTVSYLLR